MKSARDLETASGGTSKARDRHAAEPQETERVTRVTVSDLSPSWDHPLVLRSVPPPPSDVGEVLQRWRSGLSLRAIARETGLDRKTVRRYIDVVTKAMRRERWMLVDDEVVHAVEAVVRRTAAKTAGQLELGVQRQRIRRFIAARMSLTTIHQALQQRGVRVSYATLRRFVIAEMGWRTKPARKLAA